MGSIQSTTQRAIRKRFSVNSVSKEKMEQMVLHYHYKLECPGGPLLKTSQGFWRESLVSEEIQKCDSKYATFCTGGIGA
jgi:hypothetical protein